jgi:hypothetical protein
MDSPFSIQDTTMNTLRLGITTAFLQVTPQPDR